MKHHKFLGMGLLGVSAAVLLAACGGSGDTDPLQKYRAQAVSWNACEPDILGITSDEIRQAWAQAGDRVRCATIHAPMDWSHPDRGDVVISMMRMAAATPAHRKGSFLLNPGGPGSDGLPLAFRFFMAFNDSNPDNPQGAQQLQLLDQYDMVGFSPRGVGASTRLECSTNELLRPEVTNRATWDTPENIGNIEYNSAKKAEACAKNPLTPYINSDATARDLDLMRGLLGDEKLHYMGYSYGTWLGSWYASLFPERVGRMLLDSSVDFTVTFEQTVTLSQPMARQQLFEDFMAPYLARHNDLVALGSTAAEVRAIPARLDPSLLQLLGGQLASLGYKRANANDYVGMVIAINGLDAVLKSAPDVSDQPAVTAAIEQHVFSGTDQELNADMREAAAALYAAYLKLKNPSTAPGPSIRLGPSEATYMAIGCNDTPVVTDASTWLGTVRQYAQQFPMFFQYVLTVHECAYWGGPKVSKPDIAPMKPLDILFVQSQYDAATATFGADKFFAQLPGARRVYVANEFAHGIYPYGDRCVDPRVTAYLLGESWGVREAVCEGLPLPFDGADSMDQKSAGAEAPVYKNPERTRKLLDEFQRGLGPVQPLL